MKISPGQRWKNLANRFTPYIVEVQQIHIEFQSATCVVASSGHMIFPLGHTQQFYRFPVYKETNFSETKFPEVLTYNCYWEYLEGQDKPNE